MPDLQKTILAILTAVNDNKMPQPKNYKKWVEASDRISFHAKGVRPTFRKTNSKGEVVGAAGGVGGIVTPASYESRYQYLIDDYILNRHPNESAEYYNWRLSSFPIVSQEIYLNAKQQILGAIFQSSQYNIESLDKGVQDYLNAIEFNDWVINILPELVFTDPYGLCVVTEGHMQSFTASEKAAPVVKWVDSCSIKQYKKGDYLLYHEDTIQERKLLVYLDPNFCIKLLQDEGKQTYSVLTSYEHGLNKLPVIENGKEFFQPFVIWADLICRNMSDDESIAKQASYPIREIVAPKCVTCQGAGTLPDAKNVMGKPSPCYNCGGKGVMSMNPGDTYLTKEKAANDQSPVQDKVRFYNPDISINDFSLRRWQVFRDLGMASMHMKFILSAQSGEAKALDRDQLQILISNVNEKLFDIAEFILKCIDGYLMLKTFADVENYIVDKPQQFQIKSEYDIQEEYTKLLSSGADLGVRRDKLDEYYAKIYFGNPSKQKGYAIIKVWDWLFGMNDSELNTRKLLGTAQVIDFVRHDRATNMINKLINQRGEQWFLNTDITTIVNQLEKELVPLVPEVTTTEILPIIK